MSRVNTFLIIAVTCSLLQIVYALVKCLLHNWFGVAFIWKYCQQENKCIPFVYISEFTLFLSDFLLWMNLIFIQFYYALRETDFCSLSCWLKYDRVDWFPFSMNRTDFCLVHNRWKVVAAVVYLSIWRVSEIRFSQLRRLHQLYGNEDLFS